MKVKRGTKGFTLIELLIVVAIIGILAAIAIPAYSSYTAKAKIAGIVHSMGAVKTAVAAYFTEAGSIPVTTAATAAAIKATYGLDAPEQYGTLAVTGATGVITATILGNVKSDLTNQTITLTPDADFKTWAWDGTAVVKPYLPKG
jgi:type IV pilus assembly protein PilA